MKNLIRASCVCMCVCVCVMIDDEKFKIRMENFLPLLFHLSTIVTTNIYSWRWFTIGSKIKFSAVFIILVKIVPRNFPQMQFSASLSRKLHKFETFFHRDTPRDKKGGERGKTLMNEIVGNIYGHWFSKEFSLKFFLFSPWKVTHKCEEEVFCVFVQYDMRRFSGSRKKNISMFFFFFLLSPTMKTGNKVERSCKEVFFFELSINWDYLRFNWK